ncbi:MAG: ISAs1 family transposase [Colwellia sp.]|nr:ISAs1 family transposase [Colwellia sp.]
MSLFQEIESIEDYRVDANKDYELADIIFLTIAAILCGAKGWKAINIFGVAQLDWLREYRNFSHGIPTRHSIGRTIRGLKADSLVSCFINFSNAIRESNGKEHFSFDGKVVRGSKHGDIDALQLMTAMVVENGLIIYQKETSTKTNEIPVMQSMLASMNIENAVITADAMHCQTETTQLIRQGKGDYVLQVKKNQGKLLNEIEAYFHMTERDFPQRLKDNCFEELDGEHGRINEREYRLLPITQWFDETEKFKDIFAVVQVKRIRQLKTKTEQETSYYITSVKENVKMVAGYIRGHWAIENSQHWVLDVTFREDESQIYADDGAINLATIRRKLLNLIKAHPLKDSVAGKMQRACWDAKFRAEILFGQKSNKA